MEDQDDNVTEDAQPAQPPQLTVIELRVLGVLMEKQLTTPDQYPLTVNSIITGCNQKSSREPITNYQQGELVRTLQGLEDKRFVRKEFGSRADKYTQSFIQQLDLGKKHQALLCLMMLRGPQTLSELNTRTQRMELFSDKDELTHCLERLCERELPYAIRLGHQPGQRGERFGHLFNGVPEVGQFTSSAGASSKSSRMSEDDQDMLSLLESEVSELGKYVQELKSENVQLRQQIESLYLLTGHSLPSSNESD
ncbi:YceH family protein [Granulosicoccus antarcticus]|uniref:Uncharacterized protein n=1 Tax=Granulosicoccus antarcticus IMCC3135 TaxID=1192854 RepID=A0A2Z2NND2_9GAMM|nr:YceH family protein [Granulosicoccus antarcticus]ASJ72982.1 hypothetical protein IMCC3135_14485 [Granulosicoccus antarcticus IMCC3135]